jgi:antitoxin (DNA-binding transcriptional repressor) of toxin-antitoxin stability system
MEVTISQFRKQIFSLVNQALEGGEVWFTHKGRRLKVVPEGKPVSKLSRITPMQILIPEDFDIDSPTFKAEFMAEMEREWESDWERDFGPAPKPARRMRARSAKAGGKS